MKPKRKVIDGRVWISVGALWATCGWLLSLGRLLFDQEEGRCAPIIYLLKHLCTPHIRQIYRRPQSVCCWKPIAIHPVNSRQRDDYYQSTLGLQARFDFLQWNSSHHSCEMAIAYGCPRKKSIISGTTTCKTTLIQYLVTRFVRFVIIYGQQPCLPRRIQFIFDDEVHLNKRDKCHFHKYF